MNMLSLLDRFKPEASHFPLPTPGPLASRLLILLDTMAQDQQLPPMVMSFLPLIREHLASTSEEDIRKVMEKARGLLDELEEVGRDPASFVPVAEASSPVHPHVRGEMGSQPEDYTEASPDCQATK